MMLNFQTTNSEKLKSLMSNPVTNNGSGDVKNCEKCQNRIELLEKKVIDRLDQQDAKLDKILKLLQK